MNQYPLDEGPLDDSGSLVAVQPADVLFLETYEICKVELKHQVIYLVLVRSERHSALEDTTCTVALRQLANDSADGHLCVLHVAVNRENRTTYGRHLLEVRDDRVRTTYQVLTEISGRRYHIDLTFAMETSHGKACQRTGFTQLRVTVGYHLRHLQEILLNHLHLVSTRRLVDDGCAGKLVVELRTAIQLVLDTVQVSSGVCASEEVYTLHGSHSCRFLGFRLMCHLRGLLACSLCSLCGLLSSSCRFLSYLSRIHTQHISDSCALFIAQFGLISLRFRIRVGVSVLSGFLVFSQRFAVLILVSLFDLLPLFRGDVSGCYFFAAKAHCFEDSRNVFLPFLHCEKKLKD